MRSRLRPARRLFYCRLAAAEREEVQVWSQWLIRTLRPHRAEEASPSPAASGALLPELEGDGMHPGADEFRSAMSHRENAQEDSAALR